MDRLTAILDTKITEVASLRDRAAELRTAALQRNDFRNFRFGLDRKGEGLGLIAEVKKASPSAGTISEEFDPEEIALSYEAAGAHAVSVLTDAPFFHGHLDHLREVRRAVKLPVLRKDFILDEVQIHEASCAGADAILLIVAALEQEKLVRLMREAEICQLDALVEVHTMEELDRALDADASIIGINNRDLTTLQVDLGVTEHLSEQVPDEVLLVSESGIKTGADTARLIDCGVDAILVGESLMRSTDVEALVRQLLTGQVPGNG